jgi:ribosome-associated protein
MRGRDPETSEFYSPSRSERRREALDVLKLAEELVALSPAQLARLPIPETVLAHVLDTQRITAHGARKRQLGFLAKQMRREDDAELDALREALIASGDAARRATLELHRVERWRDRLLAEGAAGIEALRHDHPTADAAALARWIEAARGERAEKRPPRAYRALFDALRALFARHD